MNPMVVMLLHLLRNPLTSTAGAGLLLTNLSYVLGMLGNGTPFATILADPHFSQTVTALGLLAAKDLNVTGVR